MNTVKKNINFFIYFLIITILFLILLKTFNEPHSGYTTLFKFYTNKEIFSEDNLLRHSILFKNSIYYSIFKILRFDLDNGIYQFILHTILISSNILFIYLIIKNFSNQKNNFYIFLFIIIISTKNHLVIDGVSSSWAFHTVTTPTSLAHSLNYIIIYFLLKKFSAISILLAFINALISFKVTWFVICLIFFYVMLYEKKKYKFLLIFIILILSLIFFKNFELEKSFYNQIELYNFTYLREFDEGSCQAVFDCKNPIRILIFICSFFIFYFLNKKNNNFQAKKVFYLILILQVLILIFYQTIYFFDLEILKIWQLVALSPVRAVAIYEFFFFFLVTNFLINKKKNLNNFFLLLSYLFFGWGNLGYLISFFFLFFLFLNYLINPKKYIIIKKTTFLIGFFLISLPAFSYVLKRHVETHISLDFFFDERNFFLKNLSTEKYKTLKELSQCNDFILLDPEINNSKNKSAKYSNVLSLKSHFFIEEAFLYGNLEKIRFNYDSILLSKSIYEKMENYENISLDFLNKKVVILIPKINEKLFSNYYQFNINESYNLVLVNYGPEQIIDKCLKSNLKLKNYN